MPGRGFRLACGVQPSGPPRTGCPQEAGPLRPPLQGEAVSKALPKTSLGDANLVRIVKKEALRILAELRHPRQQLRELCG